jgi:uncharacterized RDD family membrane protein YckC
VASRGARVGALMLDLLFVQIALVVIFLLLLWAFTGVFSFADGDTLENAGGPVELIVVTWILISFSARYGYFLFFELGPRGATPGKRLLGIRVASRNGAQLSAEAVVARNLIRDIELFLPLAFIQIAPSGEAGSAGVAGMIWFVIFMLIPFLNKNALRAGDIIAGTWVVEAPRTKLEDTLSTQGAASGTSWLTGAKYEFGEDELSVYGERELQTLERVLRENNQAALESVHAAICRKIGWEPGGGDERAFLEALYAQLRAKLEGGMRFGKRKKDKFS